MIVHDLPIRKSISGFNVHHLFTRMRKLETESELDTPQEDFRLWAFTVENHQPPLLIYDTEKVVKPSRLEYCLEPIRDKETLDHINGCLPNPCLKRVEEIWGQWPDTDTSYFKPVMRLRSAEALKELDIDWIKFVENHVAAFTQEGEEDEKQKDSRLILVHKCTLPEGLDLYLAPHGIQCTNGGTGKSEFYFNVGHNFGKVTANTFLGFAKSPTEIYPGCIDGTKLPVAIDQIESQSAPRIMAYMFNAMERGKDNVASGGVVFPVSTRSTINLLANPPSSGTKTDASKSFRYLLYHLSSNAAFGRRLGYILYGTDFKKIRRKPSQSELEKWRRSIDLFRAVEEFCECRLREIVANHTVREWINKEIPDYETQIQLHAETIEDENVRTFIMEHASGAQARVRGAALYGTLVDLLDKIALDNFTITEILEHAEDLLSEITTSNIDSIAKIAQNWTLENADYAKMVFRNLPVYLREMLSAIELWRRQYPDQNEVLLTQIPYEGKDKTYAYLSKCAGKLSKRTGKGKGQALEQMRTCFHVELLEKPNDGWLVHYLKTEPCSFIEPLGQLISPISPNSPFPQSSREPSDPKLPDFDGSDRKDGEMGKIGKTGKTNQQDLEHGLLGRKFRTLDDCISNLILSGVERTEASQFVQQLERAGRFQKNSEGLLEFVRGGS